MRNTSSARKGPSVLRPIRDTRPARLRHLCLVSLCLGFLAGAGCRKASKESPPEAKDAGITRTAVRGPVSVSVHSNRSRATIAERFTLTITAVAEDGVDVVLPKFGESLGEFAVRDFQETTARPLEAGKRQWQQVYQIDAEASGKYKVEPFTVQFTDQRKNAALRAGTQPTTSSQPGVSSELVTEGFELEVTSLLEGEFDPGKFRDVKGPAVLPREPVKWARWAIGAAVALAVLVTGILLLIRRRRGKGPLTVTIPPHEWAMDELRRLVEEDLIGKQQVQLFYYRLNGIVRQYIELRFNLMAPEMTTEEFLEALRHSNALIAAHKGLIEGFCAACDMVKYARYAPGKEEIEQVFRAARDLIEQTAPAAGQVAAVGNDIGAGGAA